MSRTDFDTLTDWIGIPVSIVALALLVVIDGRLIVGLATRRLVIVVALVLAVSFGLNVARFTYLA